jgi:hypothetical protein
MATPIDDRANQLLKAEDLERKLGIKVGGPPYVPRREVECIASLISAVPSRVIGCPTGSL